MSAFNIFVSLKNRGLPATPHDSLYVGGAEMEWIFDFAPPLHRITSERIGKIRPPAKMNCSTPPTATIRKHPDEHPDEN
jgi:hypothetical protein